MRLRNTDTKGFSLIELMIAMTVTLIVTGAIYGLMTGGQNAFRREPAMTDRQQNIRLAMDIIMRDIASAGTGMPPFIQTLTPGLNSCAACPDAPGGAATPGGPRTDDLEIMANPWGNGLEEGCGNAGTGKSHARLVAGTTSATEGSVVWVLVDGKYWTLRYVSGDPDGTNNGGEGTCANGSPHADVPFNSGSDPTGYNLPSGICAGTRIDDPATGACVGCRDGSLVVPGNSCCSPVNGDPCEVTGLLRGDVVRYQIRETNGVPDLYRRSSADPNAGFQLIARGIDDLQVVYTTADGATHEDGAPVVDSQQRDYNSLIQRVTVTLSARSEAQNVAGAKEVAVGPAALRGQLTSIATPRAVLDTLGTRVPQREAGWSGPLWY